MNDMSVLEIYLWAFNVAQAFALVYLCWKITRMYDWKINILNVYREYCIPHLPIKSLEEMDKAVVKK